MLETGLTRRTCINKNTYVYTDSLCYMPLCMKRYYTLAEDGLHLKIEISNITNRSVELGDIAFPFKWREGFNAAPSTIFESNFTHKHNIALNSSFQILSKPSGVGPFYIMMTGEGTPLEYFDTTNNVYTAYLHSGCTGPKTEGSWRIPHTTRVLTPGEKVNYSFLLTSVSRYEDIRNAIYTNGLLDVRTAPGYTIPSDLSVRVAIRLKGTIQSLVAEHRNKQKLNSLEEVPMAGTCMTYVFTNLERILFGSIITMVKSLSWNSFLRNLWMFLSKKGALSLSTNSNIKLRANGGMACILYMI